MNAEIRKIWISAMLLLAFSTGLSAGEKNDQKKAPEPKEVAIKVEKTKETVKITATGKSGFHCNTLYPWKLTVESGNNQQKVYKKEDAKSFTQRKVVFEIPYSKGESGKLKLSVCNDVQCIMHEEKLTW